MIGARFSIVSGWAHVWHVDISVSDVDPSDPAGHPRTIVEQVTDGRAYLDTIRRVLDRLSQTCFDLLIHNAGMDPFEHCAIGSLAGITKEVLDQREQMVFDWARARKLPVAFVLAGGYARRSAPRQTSSTSCGNGGRTMRSTVHRSGREQAEGRASSHKGRHRTRTRRSRWTADACTSIAWAAPHGWQGGCSLGFGGSRNWPLKVPVTPSTSLVVTGEGQVAVHRTRQTRGRNMPSAGPSRV